MNIFRTAMIAGTVFGALAAAQDNQQHVTVPFRDAAAPKKLEINLAMANITVRGEARADAVVDYTTRGVTLRRTSEPPPPGMHRIGGSGSVDVSQDNNVVRIGGAGMFSGNDVTVQVPAQTAVTISSGLGGKIVIENISGEIDVTDLNGEITLTNVSGPVVAHSMNGKIVASLIRVAPDKTMSFSTFNGDVDVTLPADSKANIKARADHGDIYTDFDVKLEARAAGANPAAPAVPAPPAPPAPPAQPAQPPQPPQTVRPQRATKRESKRAVRPSRGDGYVEGTINGGGPEIQFTTFNGRILIHKK